MNQLLETFWKVVVEALSDFIWCNHLPLSVRILVLLGFTILFLFLILFLAFSSLSLLQYGNMIGGIFLLIVTSLLTILLLLIYYQMFFGTK